MNFPIVIHKDKKTSYGVTVPDLPGCFSAGDTMGEVLHNVSEAILCHIEGLFLDGGEIPSPLPIEVHQKNKDFQNGIWAMVSVDLSQLKGKAKRINITMPERVLAQMDSLARQKGETRSGLLLTAAIEYMAGK